MLTTLQKNSKMNKILWFFWKIIQKWSKNDPKNDLKNGPKILRRIKNVRKYFKCEIPLRKIKKKSKNNVLPKKLNKNVPKMFQKCT